MPSVLHCLHSRTLYRNPYWEYRMDGYTLPDGSTGDYHYAHSSGSVLVVPRDKNGTFLMVRQYRYLNRRFSLEFPGGGGLKKGMLPVELAATELAEEAGYVAGKLTEIGSFSPCNGLTDEICNVFAAEDLSPLQDVRPDPSEEFEVVRVAEDELSALIQQGELWDGMTLASWLLYKNWSAAQK